MNEIIIQPNGDRTIVGESAHKLALSANWEKALKQMLPGRFCVFETDGTLRASQTTVRGAHSYLTDERVMAYYQ